MTTPEEEFDTYVSHGEDFIAEDQVAALLTESSNLPELTLRVAECRSTYLTELQVLLMGYHEDFLQIGHQMKDICDVVEDLKTATRRGRTAIGDVSAWSLPQNSDSATENLGSTFALGDPWAEEQEASEQFNHHHSFTSAASRAHQSGAAALIANNNRLNQVILPIAYLATLSRTNDTRNPSLDQIGQAAALISSAQKTERLLHCALEQVQRRIISNRQIFGLKEVDEIAQGASQELGERANPAPSALSLLRSGVLDSFEEESWSRHPLGIGDLEPRWNILADVGRAMVSSSLLLRTHTALINDFSTSLIQSSVDIRMATLRFSTVLSAILQHAAVQREETIRNNNNGNINNSNINNNNNSNFNNNEDDDPAALTSWAMREITRAATDVFAPFIERRKHVAPTAEAAGSGRAFQSATIVSAADSIAMDIALASNFLAISLPAASDSSNNISASFFPTTSTTFLPLSSTSTNLLGPLTFTLLRTTQPNQLNFFWDQLKSAVSTDFNFAPAETAAFLLPTTLSPTYYGDVPTDADDAEKISQLQLMREVCGCEQLPRQSVIRAISPFLSGVQQHRGLAAFFDSDEWIEFCSNSSSQKPPATKLKQLSDLLLGAYVSEASRKLWDHFTNVITLKQLVANQLRELNEQMTNHSASAGKSNNSSNNSCGIGSEQQLLLIDFYFSHPDWEAQVDLALSHILSSFTTAILGEYRDLMNSSAKKIILYELEQRIAEAESQQLKASAFVTPPVLSCFRPHLFVSTVDIAIACNLAVVVPAATVAGLLLRTRIDRDDDGSVNESTTTFSTTIDTKCSRICQRKIFNFIIHSVFFRSGTSYSPAISLGINELRLRADGGGSLQNFGEDYESIATNFNDKLLSSVVAERAAVFLLLPYTNSAKGEGELNLSVFMASNSNSNNSNESLLSNLLCHKILQMLAHCQKIGGPIAACLYSVGLAIFVSDASSISSSECWNILFTTRAAFLKKIFLDEQQQSSKSSNNNNNNKIVFSSTGISILAKAISSVLYMLSPALEIAKAMCFPDLFPSSLSIYDDCVNRVKNGGSSSVFSSANASSFSFESVLSSTARDANSAFTSSSSLDCCYKNLNDMRNVVKDLATVSTGRR